MKSAIALALGAACLSGCVFIDVDGDFTDDALEEQTERAIEVCGQGNVAKVNPDGFRCKSDEARATSDDL